ncbi:MAG: hypothetical protein N0E48_08345, partial [Candidatus Thiodiazotropha endolucinida]|nr:hypothetical protein [Candidatus Thiodiazotropha taylori]MCW4343355.1 hypothetical protein [Candidatus Thiodiazotropha endolucinida]
DNDELQGDTGSSQEKPSLVSKRPASSPAHNENEAKKYVGQGVEPGTIREHVENDLHFPEMELDASEQHVTDRKNDVARMQPSEIVSQISRQSVDEPLTVHAEIHNENNDSRVLDVVTEISERSAEGLK